MANVKYPLNEMLGSPLPSDQKYVSQLSSLLQITNENSGDIPWKWYCENDNDWALTFDDGPEISTLDLLDILSQRKILATFFVTGANVYKHPEILQRIYQDGHEIGIHTWTHSRLTNLNNGQIITELLYTRDIIIDTIGVSPLFVRPPYGGIDERVGEIIHRLGFEIVMWSRDTRDASEGADKVQPNVDLWVKDEHRNCISLQHDVQFSNVAQVPLMIEKLQKFGVEFVKVSQCIKSKPYRTNIKHKRRALKL
jgi:peptidoglycan/xylan/chitin deacetylase (PgdA/CDA1 family)